MGTLEAEVGFGDAMIRLEETLTLAAAVAVVEGAW